MSTRVTRFRAALVEAAATCVVALVGVLTWGSVVTGGRTLTEGALATAPFDRVLVQVCAAALLACAAWGWLATTAVVLDVVRVAPARRRRGGVPRPVRRLVLAACGVALVGGTFQPALAAPTPLRAGGHHRPAAVRVLDGLPFPDRALGGAPPHRPAATSRGRSTQTVVVHPGDTLWDLAAADLPSTASTARIAEHCHALYAANRTVIGPDPDLIEPGQTLHLPGKDRR